MKKIIIFAIAAMVSLPAFTQELSKKEQRKLEKELKKEQQAAAAAQKAEVVTAMVEYQRFVLEANTLRDKRGNSLQVASNINFISYYCPIIYEFYCKITSFTIPNKNYQNFFHDLTLEGENLNSLIHTLYL